MESNDLPTVEDALRDFQMLKADEGLNPRKMAGARAVMFLMGEAHSELATQRLLDDLAELSGVEGEALRWALSATPNAVGLRTLEARRRASGQPENTAKDREKRAAKQLLKKWLTATEDWVNAGYDVSVQSLPVLSSVRLGSMKVDIHVREVPSESYAAIILKVTNRVAKTDYLSVAANHNAAMIAYGTTDITWQTRLHLPPFRFDELYIERAEEPDRPRQVLIERTVGEGRVVTETIAGELLGAPQVLRLDSRELAHPVPISWWWVDRPQEEVAHIAIPSEDLDSPDLR